MPLSWFLVAGSAVFWRERDWALIFGSQAGLVSIKIANSLEITLDITAGIQRGADTEAPLSPVEKAQGDWNVGLDGDEIEARFPVFGFRARALSRDG